MYSYLLQGMQRRRRRKRLQGRREAKNDRRQ
jgi:hypothetical protein